MCPFYYILFPVPYCFVIITLNSYILVISLANKSETIIRCKSLFHVNKLLFSFFQTDSKKV